MSNAMENISWKIIDKYFKDNASNLVAHHLESYNDFFSGGIHRIFKENNPIRIIEREDEENANSEQRNQCLLYLGGKNGEKLYFGKPIIYDDNHTHYMYPNDARLRNMTYGITIHYDVDVEYIYYENDEKKEHSFTLEQIYLGRFPIMLQSNLCILKSLAPNVRFNMGECKNDYGGYFIIDGKEKVIVSQEKFADNMLYIRKNKPDNLYSYSAEILSVSEDASKPVRTTAVKMVAGPASVNTIKYSMEQLVVNIPNVRKPIPLFILMRALGVISDKNIIEYCLLDLEKYESYIDLFIPSIHDANKIFNQETALLYIARFTKRLTIAGVLDILMNYFLPNIGEENFLDKAYFIGYMVKRLLQVYKKEAKPTDRDNFRFKRVELTGSLIYDLFREYFLIQKREISLKIDKEYYYHKGKGNKSFLSIIDSENYREFFKERTIETGFKKAFKGNWGSEAHTKRIGAVQDLNRLSWNSFISQLRKINLPLDASAKVVGPRLLHASQWGYIDPVDTPDGGNIGLHKHMSISAIITNGTSSTPLIKWLRAKTSLRLLQECNPEYLGNTTKIFVNGAWIGVIDNPIDTIKMIKLFRRNGLIPVYTSISFDYEGNEIFMYTDAGRLSRPVYYVEDGKGSYNREHIISLIQSGKFSWNEIIAGFKDKSDKSFDPKKNKIYDIHDLYHGLHNIEQVEPDFIKNKAVVDYIDTAEEEGALIATALDDLKKSKYYTHLEIDPSLILGVLGNMVIFPENNPITRDAFSCGQSKQAVSVYHSNYQMRIDKMGVILNYGQKPLVKSRYLEYVNKEEQPYGINAIVAIMSYTGYNVEDAILINEGSLKRGLFNTTYYSSYEAREESSKVAGSTTSSRFDNIQNKNVVGIKPGYDYSHLDKHGLIKENTPLDDKMVLIGKITSESADSENAIDASVFPKKGQLGFVDKSFITEGEEGFRLAKIRVREERLPAIGDKMACALPTQQVLTNYGWVEIKDIDINKHKVATLSINGNMIYEYPVNKFEYDHKGEMYYVKNKQVEVICTLNHKLYIKRREKTKGDKRYELIEAENVIGKMVRFQKSMKNVYPDVEYMILGDTQYKMDDWLQLLGMFIADGSVNNRAVILSALKHRKRDFNIDLLTKLGIEYYHDSHNGYFAINIGKNIEIYEEFKKYNLGALNKHLPEYVWSLSQRQCIILLEALMEGDGHTYADGFSRYGTISPKLANDICRLAVHCGWSGITKIAAEPGDNKHIITGTMGYNAGKSHEIESHRCLRLRLAPKHTYYKISIIRKQNQPYINKKVNDSNEEKIIDYEGKVYCIEMPSSHLYYMRENNLAPSMLIGNSRAGQKGTLGLIIPEEDMPFTADGTRPDLIINPHAIPSRMTIGQLIETMLGKVGAIYGGFGDCTAFANKGPNTDVYGAMLVNAGFHSSGNQLLYNGMTGEQLYSSIYIGPTYYMRLKHMVKDKINYRARGPNTMLTRQSVQGRANDGGLRIGEMERDGILAHGMAGFLNESYLIRGDEYFMAVCNKTGSIAIYNQSMNLFVSPFADGPVQYNKTLDGKMNIQNISRFGRSFSIVRVPYALKLMIQELQVMNVQMRIITEDNIDQLMSMSYSNNINKLLKDENMTKYGRDMESRFLIRQYLDNESEKINKKVFGKKNPFKNPKEQPEYNDIADMKSDTLSSDIPYASNVDNYRPNSSDELNDLLNNTQGDSNSNSPKYNPYGSTTSNDSSIVKSSDSIKYATDLNENLNYLKADSNSNSPKYNPYGSDNSNSNSPKYAPDLNENLNYLKADSNSNSPKYNPYGSDSNNSSSPPPTLSSVQPPVAQHIAGGAVYPNIDNPELKAQWDTLSENDKILLTKMLDEKRMQKKTEFKTTNNEPNVSILNVEEKPMESLDSNDSKSPSDDDNSKDEKTEKKHIVFNA